MNPGSSKCLWAKYDWELPVNSPGSSARNLQKNSPSKSGKESSLICTNAKVPKAINQITFLVSSMIRATRIHCFIVQKMFSNFTKRMPIVSSSLPQTRCRATYFGKTVLSKRSFFTQGSKGGVWNAYMRDFPENTPNDWPRRQWSL